MAHSGKISAAGLQFIELLGLPEFVGFIEFIEFVGFIGFIELINKLEIPRSFKEIENILKPIDCCVSDILKTL
jgi:hypothetical protein